MTKKAVKEEVIQKEVNPFPNGFITGSEQLGEPVPRVRNKVSIVGFAPTSMSDVQFVWDDPDMEVWGLNQLYMAFPPIVAKATRWFQIHHRHSYDINVGRDVGHHEWLTKQRTFPIYMQNKEPDVPLSIRFPKEDIVAMFGSYFTNSISWEIALAIMEGFQEISIFGVDMAQIGEYKYERPSVEFFCGWARGRGIKLNIPAKSDLLKTMWLYPYEDSGVFREKMESRKTELASRAAGLFQQEQATRDHRMQLIGAQDNMNYVQQSWENSANEMATGVKK
jgi:hypothetical protein